MSAAKTPITRIAAPAPRAIHSPPDIVPSVDRTISVATFASAAVITRIRRATKMFGKNAMMPSSRALTGFGPKTPNASWSAMRKTAQNVTIARMSEASNWLRASASFTAPRSTQPSKPTRSSKLSTTRASTFARK